MTSPTIKTVLSAAAIAASATSAIAATVSPFPTEPSITASMTQIDNKEDKTVQQCLVLNTRDIARAVLERNTAEIQSSFNIESNPEPIGKVVSNFAKNGIETIAQAPVATVSAYTLNGILDEVTTLELTVADIEADVSVVICGKEFPYGTKGLNLSIIPEDLFMSEVTKDFGVVAIGAAARTMASTGSQLTNNGGNRGTSIGGSTSTLGSINIGGSSTGDTNIFEGDTFITGDTFELTKVNITKIFADNTTNIPADPPSPVPLPQTGFLLFAGLVGLGAMARKKAGPQEPSPSL